MPKTQTIDEILSDPLSIHFALKQRGSDFAKIARSVSTPDQPISAATVRATVYGVSARHHDTVMKEVRRVLADEPVRRSRSMSAAR